MKQLIALALLLVLAPAAFSQGVVKKKDVQSSATPAPTPVPAPTKAAAKATKGKSWTGTVSSLVSCAGGKCASLTVADAQKSASHNEVLILCVGKKGYVILNPDGTNASSKLASLAAGKVTVAGKMLNKNGLNVILADSIN